jgi:RNA polymerase sigma factor (sigma-70 family)
MYTFATDASSLDSEALIRAARAGDRIAQHDLYSLCLPIMRRWARGWLRGAQCDINDPDDLVQTAVLHTLQRLSEFEVRGAGSFLAYLRQVLLNEVRGELRRSKRRCIMVECDDDLMAGTHTPADEVLALEREHALGVALANLSRRQRHHVELRVRLGMSFGEIAEATGGSTDGARMIVSRSIRAITRQLAPLTA